jgi:cell wall-associated NlpC family hydrolase
MNLDHYLGRAWEPTGFNCWGLLREFYCRELAIELPAIGLDATRVGEVGLAFLNHDARRLFKKIDLPKNNCAVVMRHGVSRYESHCGIYLELSNQPYVLHNWRGCGVLCEPLVRLQWQGLTITGYYQYHE